MRIFLLFKTSSFDEVIGISYLNPPTASFGFEAAGLSHLGLGEARIGVTRHISLGR